MKSCVILLLMISTFFVHPVMTKEELKNDEKSNKEKIQNIFYNKALQISETLIKMHETDLNGNFKWKKILNAQNSPYISDQYYSGLYSGVAGIGYFFLKMYEYSMNKTFLEVAEKAADYVFSQRKFITDLIYWSRSEYYLSDSYTSQKYGSAGIADFFLSLYETTKNTTYLSYSEQSLNSLRNNALNYSIIGKQWGYSFFDTIPLTGFTYGVTGISSSLLNLYETTGIYSYLQDSLDAMEWVLSLSSTTNHSTNVLRSILYSNVSEYPYNYTGLSSGIAGIGAHFLHLYSVTRNITWLIYATQLGNWLIENEHDGLWLYGGVDYLTGSYNEDGNFLGISAGSAGIGMFLLDLYSISDNVEYKEAIERIYNRIIKSSINSQGYEIWPIQTKGYYNETVTTGLGNGISGIGLFFNKFYRIFNNDSALDQINSIHGYLEAVSTNENLIPSQVNETYFDSSFFEGLAGIGLFYLDSGLSVENNGSLRNIIFHDNFYFKSFEATNLESTNNDISLGSLNFTLLIPLGLFYPFKRYIKHRKS